MAIKVPVWLTLLSVLTVSPTALIAQQDANQTRTITGCLHQGIEPGGYYLDTHDGKMWELRGSVNKANVGREVSVEGHEQQPSMAHQTGLITDEKQEANGRAFQGFEVASMKMLSNSCH